MSSFLVDSLFFSYGDSRVLSGVYLKASAGEILGMVGRNGTGKSTFYRCVYGSLAPEAGVVKVDGCFVARGERWKQIAYLPQEGFLPATLRVDRALGLLLDARGREAVAGHVRIQDLLYRPVGTLSTGERRLLELLIVLELGRPVLLLDEPFAAVEPLYRDMIVRLLVERRNSHCTIVSDHDLESIREVCTRFVVLEMGRFVALGK